VQPVGEQKRTAEERQARTDGWDGGSEDARGALVHGHGMVRLRKGPRPPGLRAAGWRAAELERDGIQARSSPPLRHLANKDKGA
jgi:hypothetical protein